MVKGFANWDIYYLYEYARTFMLHGDGEPLLIEYQDAVSHFCYVAMKRDISEDPRFSMLSSGTCYDLETPYGYGGPLSDGPVPEESQKNFASELKEYCVVEGIVEQFVRFHPLLGNHETVPLAFELRYLHDTIFIDTSTPEVIMANMDCKNRNMVRKAVKNGVTIERKPIEAYEEFLRMYEETMKKDQASQYYFFKRDYFAEQSSLKDHACIFYAKKEGLPIAGAIFYFNDRFLHYHLAGTHTEYRKYAPSNLMLYEAACWANEKGIGMFHLGGGMSQDDNLFGFKKQFNKNGRLPFWVGRTIFDPAAYERLLDMREQTDPDFDRNNSRMTQYRF